MHGQVDQALPARHVDQRRKQEMTQSVVSVLGEDVHTLKISRAPPPPLRSWNPFDHSKPSHAEGLTFRLYEEGHMRPLMFDKPTGKIASELKPVSTFSLLDCPPDPPQPSEHLGIGQVGSAS